MNLALQPTVVPLRRLLGLLLVAAVLLMGVNLAPSKAAANGAPIDVTLDVRACPERGDIGAHVYVWPSVTANGPIADYQVGMRFRLVGDSSWQEYGDAFRDAMPPHLFTDIGTAREFEVQYRIAATEPAWNSWGPWTALSNASFTVPVSIDLATQGSGTAGDPYRISTAQHLGEVGCLALGGQPHFVLENDIVLSGPFLPLGSGSSSDTRLTLDGRGYAIRGLDIDRPMNSYVGLFANARNLVVRDLRIIGPQVTGIRYVGPLAGELDGAVVSRLTIDDAEVRVSTVEFNSGAAGGVVGESSHSLFSDIRWSADIRSVPGLWPFDRARPDSYIARVGGFAGEDDEQTHLRRVSGAVTIDIETDRVQDIAGLFGYPDEESLWSHVFLDATIRIRTADAYRITGIGGDYLDVGTSLVDAIVQLDLEIEALPGRSFQARQIGGLFGDTEEGDVLRVDVSGSILIDARTATGGTIEEIGGMVGRHGNSSGYTTVVSESRSDVDVTILAGAVDVRIVGALFGSIPNAIGGVEDVLVTGSVVIETTTGTVERIGGLVGFFGTSSGTRAHLGRVIWRGGLTIDGLSGDALLAANLTDVGALLGSDSGVGAQRSHCVFWDVANGFTAPDTLLPGSPRTAAQLVTLLDGDCGFTTGFVQDSGAPVAWCLDDDGAPAITALTAECGSATIVRQVAPTAPAGLRFACVPLQAMPGDRITCFATGADPNIDILWSASASPAFAGGPVTTNALGDLAFTFVVPRGMEEGTTIGVELVAWTSPVLIRIGDASGAPAGTDGQGLPLPTRVPAGDGGPGWTAITVPVLLAILAILGTIQLMGLGPLARVRTARTPRPEGGALGAG